MQRWAGLKVGREVDPNISSGDLASGLTFYDLTRALVNLRFQDFGG